MNRMAWLALALAATGVANATTYEWPGGAGNWTDPGWTMNGGAVVPVWNSSADAHILGGSMALTPSANPGTPIHDIYLKPGGGTAELNIGADVSGRTVLLGHDGDTGPATVNQTAGTVSMTGYNYIGYHGSGTNTYNLSGGSFSAGNGFFHIGQTSTGILNINGGTLNASPTHFEIGQDGTGTLNLDSGEVNFTGDNLWLGYRNSASGTVNVSGGTFSANAVVQVVVANRNDASGAIAIDGGVFESSSPDFIVGGSGNAVGTIALDGGLFRLTGEKLWLGYGDGGEGSFLQTGGTSEVAKIVLANTNTASGTYSISGGILDASSYIQAKEGGVFEVSGSGAERIETGEVYLSNGGTFRVKLDANGSTLVKDDGRFYDRGIFLDNAIFEVDTLSGFDGQAGDTYDIMWTAEGFATNGMSFVNRSFTGFGLEIVDSDGGEVLRLTVLPATTNSLRLFSYNIHHGEGEDGVVDLDRTGDVIAAADPDLVALQEVDKNTTRSGYVDQAKVLAQRLGMEYRFMKNLDYQGGEYGNALLSRYPIQATYLHPLPANGGEPRGALEEVVEVLDLYGRTNSLSFISLHLDHLSDTSRVSQVQTLLADLSSRSHPVVLAGDFNARPTEGSIALLESNGYDPLDPSGTFTYPSGAPNRKIDYIMAKGLSVSESTFQVIAETMASDHRPLLAETFLGAPADWLDGYGLEAGLMENFADSDGDGMDNYSEWLTGTDPTNALSFFGFQVSGSGMVPTGFQLRWNSITDRTYRVESSTNLVDGAFQTLESGIQGLEGATEYIDTNATGKARAFYRVFVE